MLLSYSFSEQTPSKSSHGTVLGSNVSLTCCLTLGKKTRLGFGFLICLVMPPQELSRSLVCAC